MSDWPKTVHVEDFINGSDLGSGDTPPPDYAVVIPADLGRELYEALRAGYPGDGEQQSGWVEKSRVALARYEREVGE